jgi:SET domain-containing protein
VIEDIEVRAAGRKGVGVFARRDFNTGEFIFRRRHARVVQNDAISSLTAEDQRHLCEIDFDRSAILLPPGCYLNHSCDPNAMRNGVKVFAWSEILEGDEITIDYRLNAFDDEDRWRCDCGSSNCGGEVIGSFFALPVERQRLYLPHTPAFIRREYRRRICLMDARPASVRAR